MSSACLACHCAISMPFTGTRTIGVTPGTTEAALAIWARLSMYCRQSRSSRPSHGLCSISNTQPSYFEVASAIAVLSSAGAKHVSACCPASSARMTPLSRGLSAIRFLSFFLGLARVRQNLPQRRAEIDDVLLAARLAPIGAHVIAAHGRFLDPVHLAAAVRAPRQRRLRRRWWRRRLTARSRRKPGGPFHLGEIRGREPDISDCRAGLTMPPGAVASAPFPHKINDCAMIIDCHGHYTTEPKDLHRFRKEQTAAANAKNKAAMPPRAALKLPDDEIRESIEGNQLKLQRERGTDLTIFSPRASGMGHHVGDESVSTEWSQICNDLIARVVDLFPKNFIGVCQLPQSPGVDPKNCAAELERCVRMGFVGCNLNPDPSGGYFNAPPMTDKSWFPLYEKMIELDVPCMIHVSGCCNPAMHTTGSYYLNADTMVFMQVILSDLFKTFPKLKFIIPHGGGAVPFHWGRFRGLALNNGKPELAEIMGDNIFFDTCVYHQPGINLLTEVVPINNILFASEMVGAVKGNDPKTGFGFDDTKRYIDKAPISDADRKKIFEGNARKVYGRLANKIAAMAAA